ncbi:hypothetical protein FQN49_003113 [Arthroderma sp. PD_2]|nr:hypothetical protein FQN49_003113 [Arthroderma sp. PD_2]
MASPRTPKSGVEVGRIIKDVNTQFDLDLLPPRVGIPCLRKETIQEKCVSYINFLYYKGDLTRCISSLEDWVLGNIPGWKVKPNKRTGHLPAQTGIRSFSSSFLRRGDTTRVGSLSDKQRHEVLEAFHRILFDEHWIVRHKIERPTPDQSRSASFTSTTTIADTITIPPQTSTQPVKRTQDNIVEVFCTAPSSPVFAFDTPSSSDDCDCDGGYGSDTYALSDFDEFEVQTPRKKQKQLKREDFVTPRRGSSKKDSWPSQTPVQKQQQKIGIYYTKVTKSPGRTESPKSKNLFSADKSLLEDSSFASTNFSAAVPTTTSTPATSFGSIVPEPPSSKHSMTGVPAKGSYTSFESNSPEPPSVKYPITVAPSTVGPLTQTKLEREILNLEQNGPFSKRTTCSKEIPLRYRYEAERVARAYNIPPEAIIPKNIPLTDMSYDEFWQALCRDPKTVLEKTRSDIWKLSIGNFKEPETEKMVVLSGQIVWKDKALTLALNPLKLEQSHRFARRFGADRFLEVTFPSTNPDKQCKDAQLLRKVLSEWLSDKEHHLLGRIWRAFFIEDYKSKSKAAGEARSKVFLFAVDGNDFLKLPPGLSPLDQPSEYHTPMTREQLVNWHIPLHMNKHQQDCKLFNRIRLGLSRTSPTITLLPEEVIYDSDPMQELMSDGCSLMSRSLGKAITECLGLFTVPACFQGRFAGAKGIWVVARNDQPAQDHQVGDRGYWIVINTSQLKIQPPPCDRSIQLDKHQLTFDVSSYAKPLHSVNLNIQFLMVLKNGGIKVEYLASIIHSVVEKYYNNFLRILQEGDAMACRAWVKEFGGSGHKGPTLTDGFPPDMTEQVKLLLDGGFIPSKLRILRRLFKDYLSYFLDNLGNLKIKIPQSTYAYCIADPYGVLKEDEVHLAFEDRWEDDSTDLDEIDVLVARAPAHLPADIQKRRATFHPALRHLKNVAVFPTTGDVPLASLLSGGDYDGDEVWVCWDPELVNPFQNKPSHDIPKPEKYGLIKVSKPVGDTPFDDFMAKAFDFNLSLNTLGMCTVEHERYCYALGGIGSPEAVDFSCLLSHLADTRKSGYVYPHENRLEYRRSLGAGTPYKPAYKDPTIPHRPDDIIDHLKFDVIKEETAKIQARLNHDCPSDRICITDKDLVVPRQKIWDLAIKERNESNSTVLLDAFQDIVKQVRKVHDDNTSMGDSISYEGRIIHAHESLMAIQPPRFNHTWSIVWSNSKDEWEKFLASCAYREYPGSSFPWFAAAKTLCGIKCNAVGLWRITTSSIYPVLEVNKSRAKKVEAERRKLEAEDDLSRSRYYDEYMAMNDDDDDWFSVE